MYRNVNQLLVKKIYINAQTAMHKQNRRSGSTINIHSRVDKQF